MRFRQCWRVIGQAFRTSYEHLGKVFLANILWFSIGFAPAIIVSYIPVESVGLSVSANILTVILLGAVTAALHYLMSKIVADEMVTFKAFWLGFKQFFLRGAMLFFVAVLGFAILIFNLWFGKNHFNLLILIMSGFWFWGLLLWYAMLQYVFPVLVQENSRFGASLKRAFLVTLDNLLPSALLSLLGILLIIISVFLAFIPLFVFVISFLAILQNHFYSEIMLKYSMAAEEE